MKKLFFYLFVLQVIISCKIEELQTPPVVKTNSSSEISSTTAKIWGEVVEEGSSVAKERGFVYSDKNPSPSTSDSKVISGYGKGEFNTLLSNLTPNTKYYYKAYASNQTGITYGDAKNFTTFEDIKLPTVSTNVISNITINSCTTGGNISSDGGSAITEKGIVFSTTPNPTISNNKITSAGSNNYSIDLTGLAENTTYYIRAFATNSKGTNYGDQQVLTTLKNYNSILKNGLVAYYPFNGNANDASGNGNNGKVNGANLTSDRKDLANSSYNFDVKNWSFGSGGDNIYIPYNISFNFAEFSISTWVKRTSDGSTVGGLSDLTIISRYEYGYNNPNGESWILNIENGNRPTGALVNGHVIEQFPSPAPYFISKSNQTVPLNKWCHIVMTYSKKTINLYINNQLVGTTSNPNITINTIGNSGISIGRVNAANGQWGPFGGSIDDVGIWNRALTAEEIKFLYDNDFRP